MSTSDLVREVHPGVRGLMMDVVMSGDNRIAAAYTNYNQTILLNAITSEFIVIDNPLKEEQTVQGLLLNDNKLTIYGEYSWYVFSNAGKLLDTKELEGEPETFPILSMRISSSYGSVPDVAIHAGFVTPRFQSRLIKKALNKKSTPQGKDYINLFILRWSGDMDNDDLMFETHKDDFNSKLTCHGGLVMNEKNTNIWTCPNQNSNDVARFSLDDGQWTRTKDYCDNPYALLQLLLSSDESYVIGTFTDGFQLWKTTNNEGAEVITLKLPNSIRNVTSKMNQSNECLLSKGNIWAIAGVRKVSKNISTDLVKI